MAAVGHFSALEGYYDPQHCSTYPLTAGVSSQGKNSGGERTLKLSIFPGEDPKIDQLKPWLIENLREMDKLGNGLGPVIRRQEPAQVVNLAPRDMTLPELQPIAALADGANATAVANREARISDFKHANMVNAKAKDAWMLEKKLQVAALLSDSLAPRAALRLARMRDKHKIAPVLAAGAVALHSLAPDQFDGIAAYWELWSLIDLPEISTQNADYHLKVVDAMRASRLPDNAPGEAYDALCNVFMRDHNDFLEAPFTGTRLSNLLWRFAPDACDMEIRILNRSCLAASTWGAADMQQQISRIVSGAHKQDRYSSADNAAVMAVLAVAGGGVGGGGGTNRSGGAPPACASVRIGGQTWSQTARREYARRPDGLMCHQKSCPFQHRDDADRLSSQQPEISALPTKTVEDQGGCL